MAALKEHNKIITTMNIMMKKMMMVRMLLQGKTYRISKKAKESHPIMIIFMMLVHQIL